VAYSEIPSLPPLYGTTDEVLLGGGDSESLLKNKAFAVVRVACSRLERKRSGDNFSKL
jgi:hypothetical protein